MIMMKQKRQQLALQGYEWHRCRPGCSTSDYFETEANVQDVAPILKGFFSKSVSTSSGQCKLRREAVCRESKQRQDRLREQAEREQIVSEELSRKRKVVQLRRYNQQRRRELLQSAVSARENLLRRIQQDKDSYMIERERWEDDFKHEIRALNTAFRKTLNNNENRPMTVAGLAVPEAILQLERGVSNFKSGR